MRILFAALHDGYYRNIESIVDALAARGHEMYLGAERPDSALGGHSIVERLSANYPNVTHGQVAYREQKTRFLASKVRLTLDFLRYLEPEYAGTPALHRRAAVRTPSGFVWPFGSRVLVWSTYTPQPPSQLVYCDGDETSCAAGLPAIVCIVPQCV